MLTNQIINQIFFLFLFFFFFFFFLHFRATPMAHGSSQARLVVESELQLLAYITATQDPAMSTTYTTAHSNPRFLTHWARPGTESASSWLPVGFISTVPQWELPDNYLIYNFILCRQRNGESKFYFTDSNWKKNQHQKSTTQLATFSCMWHRHLTMIS